MALPYVAQSKRGWVMKKTSFGARQGQSPFLDLDDPQYGIEPGLTEGPNVTAPASRPAPDPDRGTAKDLRARRQAQSPEPSTPSPQEEPKERPGVRSHLLQRVLQYGSGAKGSGTEETLEKTIDWNDQFNGAWGIT